MSKNNYISKIKNPKFILALSIILLTIIVLCADYIKNHTNYFSKKSTVPVINNIEDEIPETLSVVVASSENSKTQEIDALISADSDEEEIKEDEVKAEETIQPNIVKNDSANENLAKIVTVHNLIAKFLQNIEYSAELDKIEKLNLPKNLIDLLEEMRHYNTEYLTNKNTTKTEVVFPNKGIITKIIGRFIKIEKSPVNLVAQENMHDAIVKDIHFIEEYFYSKNLLDKQDDHD